MPANTDITRKAVAQADAYFDNGFHCAEAVAAAVLETLGKDSKEAAAHATAFGGGFAGSHQEACGALAGALIAIGHLHGRRIPREGWNLPAQLGTNLRERFLADFGTTHCATLRDKFGEGQQPAECRRVVRKTTHAIMEILSVLHKPKL